MKNRLKLTTILGVSVNHYLNYRVCKHGKKLFVQSYKPEETLAYEKYLMNYLKNELKNSKWKQPEPNKLIAVDMVYYLKRKDQDAHNYHKVLFDMMTKAGVWKDDNIVMERVKRIYYDKENPRIEMEVYTMDYIGVFDSEKEYSDFINKNCNKCKRSRLKCSIHKDCINNIINKNFSKNQCLKKKEIKTK